MPDHLLIFVRNPILGKVKTRLASTVGNTEALRIYRELLQCTQDATKELNAQKCVYYSDFIDITDVWDNELFLKRKQAEGDLGERMAAAFEAIFAGSDGNGMNKAIIIGSDCPGLTKDLLENAFHRLDQYDVVIGPSTDGGYYLLGTREFVPKLFQGIPWSTEAVLETTLAAAAKAQKSYFCLPKLSDVDTEIDWRAWENGEEAFVPIR
jgi:uncharacterized protein